ncbi:MAG: hypothetical protein ABIK37_00255, partial [candidate division WOR-3 bacterium]
MLLLLLIAMLAPGSGLDAVGAEETLHFDTVPAGGFAVLAATEYYAGVRFTPARTCSLKAVTFYQFEAAEDGRVYIYGQQSETRPGPLRISKTYSGAGGARWKRVDFDSSVVCDSGIDFWAVVQTTYYSQEHPLGVDRGPLVRWRGGYIKVPEISEVWYQLTESPFFENRNWNIRAIVTGTSGVEEEMVSEQEKPAAATIVGGALRVGAWPGADGSRQELLDISGRRVL